MGDGHPEDEAPPARVLVVDDHELVAEALTRALRNEPDLFVVGRAGSVADAIRLARQFRPQVILMDFLLPDGEGTQAASLIRQELPDTEIVMLTGVADAAVLAQALEAGCSGFVAKGGDFRELPTTIRSVLAGQVRVPPDMLEQLASYLRPRPSAAGSELTKRELEVLQMLADGKSTGTIVRELVLSVHTVRNHIRNILTKLHAQSRLEAVAVATRQGLIRPPKR
jgi:DNA-binding NarL/FixJ family response regulator